MNQKNEIRALLSDFGGEVKWESPLKVKQSPHSPPCVIYGVSTDNIPSDHLAQATIIQRLKWMLHQKNK